MEFNPEMSDRELLELLSIATRVPPIRRLLVAKLEQMVLIHKDEIEALDSQIPFITARPPSRPLNDYPSPGITTEPRVYPFKLVKKQENWVQEVPGLEEKNATDLYLLLPEVIKYITSQLLKKKMKNISHKGVAPPTQDVTMSDDKIRVVEKVSSFSRLLPRINKKRVILSTSRGIQFYNVKAERVSKKEITGTLTVFNENCYVDETLEVATQPGSNIIYINTEGFNNLPDQEKIHGMIEYINIHPGLRKSLLDYFYIILKPLFINAREKLAK